MKICEGALDALLEQLEDDPVGVAEGLKVDFALALERRRRALKLTNKDLAQRIGASPAYVSKVMGGDCNLTVESIAKLALAVEGRPVLVIEEKSRPFSYWADTHGASSVWESTNAAVVPLVNVAVNAPVHP